MELEITWKRAIRIWWSYFWRNLLAVIASLFIGVIVGGVIGLILGIAGVPPETIKIVCMPIGAIIGLALSVVPIKLILGKDFGEFRLVLVSKEAPPLPAIPEGSETDAEQ